MIIYVFMVTSLVLGEVVLRNVFARSIPWAEEAARYFLIGTTFIGASVAFREGAHVGVTILVKQLPDIVKKIFIVLANIVVLIILWYVFWRGVAVALHGLRITGDILPIRLFYVRVNIPLGAFFMFIHLLYYVVAGVFSDDPEEFLISQPVAVEEDVETR